MNIQKALISLFLLMLFPMHAFATGQQADVLVYAGKTYDLFSNPLEDYYPDEDKRPQFWVRPGTMSSGNWRGYVATWEIIGDKLYLSKIDSWFCGGRSKSRRNNGCHRVTLRELFGKRVVNGMVLASWFSGELRVPDGKELEYVHMGYGSVYERDILFEVKAGKILKREVVDNTNRERPSNLELQRQELEKLKKSPLGDKPIVRKPNI
ncbi:MAG: hypothetical protein AB1757_01100 [Acidobacteriota bacterium]